MRVLMMAWRDIHHPLAGGAEQFTHEMLLGLGGRGHSVTLFTSRPARASALDDRGPYPLHRHGNRFTVYRDGRRYLQANYRLFDVVIDQVNTVPFQVHQLGLPVPAVGFFHQTAEEIWGDMVPFPASTLGRHILEPRWLRGFRGVPSMVVSQSTGAALGRFGVTPATVIGEALLAAEQRRDAPLLAKVAPARLICVSRLVPYKRVDRAIAAASLVRDVIPGVELDIVGDGPDRRALQRRAPSWVHFHGKVTQSRRDYLLRRASLHLATSVREGWAMTVSEAALAGTPTIAFDAPGLRDSTKAAHGWLVHPSSRAMADRVISVLRGDALQRWRSPARGGLDSWECVLTRVEQTLTAAIDGFPRSST